MALRALNTVTAVNYNKLSADPILAGDILAIRISDTSQNPPLVMRATRNGSLGGAQNTIGGGADRRGFIVGVSADDALGTNPNGETPQMINNDPAGSNFVNGNIFQSYTAGFYVGAKRAIGDFKDESIAQVTNLTASIPTYAQRGVSVYNTPGSQFVTDRFQLKITATATTDGAAASWTPVNGDLLTVSADTVNGALSGTLVKLDDLGTDGPAVGRVDFYDSGAALLYWTLL